MNTTVSPTFGVASSTVLVTDRSITCGVIVAVSVLFALVGSNWSPLAVAELTFTPIVSTVTVSVSVAVAPLARSPTVHVPVESSNVPWVVVSLT